MLTAKICEEEIEFGEKAMEAIKLKIKELEEYKKKYGRYKMK